MINIKSNRYNLIIGTILGAILARIVIIEGCAITAQSKHVEGALGIELFGNTTYFLKILSFISFLVPIFIFNAKAFRKINFNKLSIYLFLSVLISFFITFEGIVLLGQIFINLFPNIFEYVENNYFLCAKLVYLVVLIGVAIFLITFVFLVNRKVKYIRFLTREVKEIKKEGFGKTIEVKGGDELSDLCKSINNMSVELGERIEKEKKIEENKHELITNISHDLKTPLTSIVGYLELLNKEDIDENTRDEYIKIAYNKSLRLKSLVNELFEYTKLSGNDMKIEKDMVNISMLLNQAVGESIINFNKRNIEVILENSYKEVFCNINAVQMLRVFENLIKNAEKYADSNSKFKISLDVKDEDVVIILKNKCEDIKNEDVGRLFEKFYRQDKSRSKEGTGLGLAIVQRIIELHKGSIVAEKTGSYIEFKIVLKKHS